MVVRLAPILAAFLAAPAAAEPQLRDFTAELIGSELHFSGHLDDDGGTVATVSVRYRAADLSMQSAEMARNHDRLLAVVDAGPVFLGGDSVRVLYSVVARDDGDNVVARLASDEEPISVIVTRVFAHEDLNQPDDPLVTAPPASVDEGGEPAWLRWVVAGVVVVGGGVALGVVMATH